MPTDDPDMWYLAGPTWATTTDAVAAGQPFARSTLLAAGTAVQLADTRTDFTIDVVVAGAEMTIQAVTLLVNRRPTCVADVE